MNDNLPTPPLQETERDRWNYDIGYEAGAKLTPAEYYIELERIRGNILDCLGLLDEMLGEPGASVLYLAQGRADRAAGK